MKKLLLVIDCDVLAYQSTAAVEKDVDWGNGLWSVYSDIEDAKDKFKESLGYVIKRCLTKLKHKGDYDTLMCFSDNNNFRKVILDTYKSNRVKTRKPCAYYGLKQWIVENYNTKMLPWLEGDDVCSIVAEAHENAVILSIDKDMKTCAAKYFDFNNEILYEPTPESSEYHWFYQTLIGDKTDNFNGLPGCGPKTAEKILDKDCSWGAVVTAYAAKGLTESDALLQARVARILHKEDYDMEKCQIRLWNSEGQQRDVFDCRSGVLLCI